MPLTTRRPPGFTLIEMLVVMAIMAMLLTIALPRYFKSETRAKEAVLKQQLTGMRDLIDKYYADNGKYPDALEDLVTHKYMRAVPRDPITDSATTWVLVAPDDPKKGGIYNVKSGAVGQALDGSKYEDW